MFHRARSHLLVVVLALGSTAGAQTPPPSPDRDRPVAPPSEPRPAGLEVSRSKVLEEVSGVVTDVDRGTHRVSIGTTAGPVQFFLDRNTMVYTEAGLGTVRDVKPGVQIRVGRNADSLAYWVQVRPPTPAATPSEPERPTAETPAGSPAP